MLIGGRLHNFALGGCVAALVFVCGFVSSVAQPKDQPPAAAQQQQAAPEEPKASQPGTPPAAKETNAAQVTNTPEIAKDDKSKAAKYRSPCGDTDDDRQADLCEQQRMSSAAESAAYYAFLQLIFGGIGLVFVVASLLFAGIAAFSARDAAIAATEAARIARNAERPYLTPFVPKLKNWTEAILEANEFKVMEVHLDITNVGKGVGFIKGYAIAHEICIEGKQGNVPLTVQDGFSMLPLREDGELDAGAAFDVFQISADDRLAMIEFDRSLYIYGYTRYSDLFGIVRRSGFMFEFIPDKLHPEKSSFVMCNSAKWWHDEEEKPQKT
jgi:hypothetical protein